MNPKKQKEKDRRRARKLAAEAWEAADAGNLDLAEKIIRRAVAAQEDNPVLWNDQGMLLAMRQRDLEAADAFRAAIFLAPTYAEPFANLAALRLRQGSVRDAVALQTQAVAHAPANIGYRERLDAYRALAGETMAPVETAPTPLPAPTVCPKSEWPQRLAALDWQDLGARLTHNGCVTSAGLMDADACALLRGLFGDDGRFAKTVVMDEPDFGQGTYRYFAAPLPGAVDALRRAMYEHVARIANNWQELLGETERFPLSWEEFREECARAGQTTPTPILLRYGPGGCNALHRDLRGSVFFPIQLAVVLSPRSDQQPGGFSGGAFLFCDAPAGHKGRRQEFAAGLGDAILFCTRDRLVKVGGAYGLQPVKHGVTTIDAGERFVLGVPFHEYR
jgi:hypothetical protein